MGLPGGVESETSHIVVSRAELQEAEIILFQTFTGSGESLYADFISPWGQNLFQILSPKGPINYRSLLLSIILLLINMF